MTDLIVVLILAVLIGFGVYSSIRHFQGKGSCCGGNSYKPRKKKLDHVMAKKVICISGMSCENCQNRVMEALNRLEGVSATVSHKKGIATVSLDRTVDTCLLKAAVENAGYMVTEIR